MTTERRQDGVAGGAEWRGSVDAASSSSERSRLRLIRLCLLASGKAAIAGVAVGLFVLVGYAFGWSPAWRPFVGGPATHPTTAAAFVITGIAVLGVRPWLRSRVGIGVAAVVGALAIAESVGLLRGQGDVYRAVMPFQRLLAQEAGAGRAIEMSMNTAATLVLISASLGCLYARRAAASQALAVLAMFFPVAALIGYVYGIPGFHGAMAHGPWWARCCWPSRHCCALRIERPCAVC